MDFMQAVKSVLNNYTNFQGRSRRSEFWWWTLAYFIGYMVIVFIGGVVSAAELLGGIFVLALVIPNLAVSVRRFHDIGKSGWWILISLIPLLGLIAIIYFFVQPSEGPNKFGEGPIQPTA